MKGKSFWILRVWLPRWRAGFDLDFTWIKYAKTSFKVLRKSTCRPLRYNYKNSTNPGQHKMSGIVFIWFLIENLIAKWDWIFFPMDAKISRLLSGVESTDAPGSPNSTNVGSDILCSLFTDIADFFFTFFNFSRLSPNIEKHLLHLELSSN